MKRIMNVNLSTAIDRIIGLQPKGNRTLVALAGAPASGKSTLAEALVTALNQAGQSAVLVPMDGFHLDNRILECRGQLDRKGAPETFDADGFIHLIGRLSREPEIAIPLFDRARDLAIAGASVIRPDQRIAVVEGNYLLFDETPWSRLRDCWDISIWVETPMEELERRLVRRWLDHGLEESAARQRARQNDLANAARIRQRALQPDLVIET